MSDQHPTPNWTQIFLRRPDLEPPGYKETLAEIAERRGEYEADRLRALMQEINKEKVSYRNKSRNSRKSSSAKGS
jgi:hypothetical protein